MTTVLFLGGIVGAIGFIPAPDRFRADGVVEPARLAFLHAREPGFLAAFLPSGRDVGGPGEQAPLIRLSNRELEAELKEAQANAEVARAEMIKAQGESDANAAQVYLEKLQETQKQVHLIQERLGELDIRSPIAGIWISPDIDRSEGGYLKAGDRAGLVASLDRVIIRATVLQDSAVAEADSQVEMRVLGRPNPCIRGRIMEILPAAQDQLPSASLGYAVGGSVPTQADDRRGTKAAERFFEVRIEPEAGARLLSGQRVVVRFDTPHKPLAQQWWTSLLQLVQRRFQI
jgi:putative peptide zinc metalloprotease protein